MGLRAVGWEDMIQNQTTPDFRFQEVGISASSPHPCVMHGMFFKIVSDQNCAKTLTLLDFVCGRILTLLHLSQC